MKLANGVYQQNETDNGDLYSGPYDSDGLRCGLGLVHFTDGGYYLGEFLDDVAHGQGKLVNREGTIFVGSFMSNDLNGKATETRLDAYQY
jgi:hypothetical protein